MNGWTPSIPVETRIKNLLAQIPQEYQNRALTECTCDNPYDMERFLTGYVLSREWEMYAVPAVEAYELDKMYADAWCDERFTGRDGCWDWTPPQDMPDIDLDTIREIPF